MHIFGLWEDTRVPEENPHIEEGECSDICPLGAVHVQFLQPHFFFFLSTFCQYANLQRKTQVSLALMVYLYTLFSPAEPIKTHLFLD